MYREGITQITDDDIRSARSLGYVVKLLAVAEEVDGDIAVRVHPAMVPVQHPLASVRDSFNAVFIEADAVGELMLYGRGAGGNPTASAVLGDLVDAARNLVGGARGATIGELVDKPIRPMDDVESPFYVLVEVADRPGVLAAIADASSGATACRSSRWSSGGSGPTRAWSSSPTARARPTCSPRSTRLRDVDVGAPGRLGDPRRG